MTSEQALDVARSATSIAKASTDAKDPIGRKPVMQWLFWQMGGLGPMAGQNHHFSQYAPEKNYAIDRYVNETNRLYGVLDKRLADREFVAGECEVEDRFGSTPAGIKAANRWPVLALIGVVPGE